MTTIQLSSAHGYVMLAATLTLFLNLAHVARVAKYRKATKLPYPHMLAGPATRAPDAKALTPGSATPSEEFSGLTRDEYIHNCAQRAHANFLESLPMVLVSLAISGVAYPRTAAAMGALWTAGRYVYLQGYTKPEWGKNGDGRLRYFWVWALTQYALVLLGGWVGVKTALGI